MKTKCEWRARSIGCLLLVGLNLPNPTEAQSLTTRVAAEPFAPFVFAEVLARDPNPPLSDQPSELSQSAPNSRGTSSPPTPTSFVIREHSLPKRFLSRSSRPSEVDSLKALREAVSRAILAKWRSLVATHEGTSRDQFVEATLEVSLDDTGKVLNHRLLDGSFGTVQESLCRLAVEQAGPYPALSEGVRDALSGEPQRVRIRLSPETVEFPVLTEMNIGRVWPGPWPDSLARREFPRRYNNSLER